MGPVRVLVRAPDTLDNSRPYIAACSYACEIAWHAAPATMHAWRRIARVRVASRVGRRVARARDGHGLGDIVLGLA